MSHYGQESAIGKALWHQVTTVVILRQNMRQKSQTPDDSKFRTALENMRYKACTPEDIIFLQSRVTGPEPKRPKLSEKDLEIYQLSLPGIHKRTESMNLVVLDLQKKLISILLTYTLQINGLCMKIFKTK
jgi:hypothetical protein